MSYSGKPGEVIAYGGLIGTVFKAPYNTGMHQFINHCKLLRHVEVPTEYRAWFANHDYLYADGDRGYMELLKGYYEE